MSRRVVIRAALLDDERRRRLLASFEEFQAAVRGALIEEDPMQLIAIGAPDDEYDVEIGKLLPLLQKAASVEDVSRIVQERFEAGGVKVSWSNEAYTRAGEKIWAALQRHRAV